MSTVRFVGVCTFIVVTETIWQNEKLRGGKRKQGGIQTVRAQQLTSIDQHLDRLTNVHILSHIERESPSWTKHRQCSSFSVQSLPYPSPISDHGPPLPPFLPSNISQMWSKDCLAKSLLFPSFSGSFNFVFLSSFSSLSAPPPFTGNSPGSWPWREPL